jgi:hypothetical protein
MKSVECGPVPTKFSWSGPSVVPILHPRSNASSREGWLGMQPRVDTKRVPGLQIGVGVGVVPSSGC